MNLQFENGDPFTTGATSYDYRPATSKEPHERVIIRILISGIKTSAMLDTGGVFFVCTPEIGEVLGLTQGAPTDKIRIRDHSVNGSLHSIELELVADDGASFTLTVTAFVPHLQPGEEWFEEFPCVLGLYGCLERLRFAVDPMTKTFHFGTAL